MAEAKINGGIQLRGEIYKPGDEDRLAAAASQEELDAMKKIRIDDFDEKKRLISGSWKSTKSGGVAEKNLSKSPDAPHELPAGFPGRAHLIKGGLTTVDAVKATSDADLLKVEGIDEATLKAIREK